jgi:formylglycine-generating enzyme required for sulfatase activity
MRAIARALMVAPSLLAALVSCQALFGVEEDPDDTRDASSASSSSAEAASSTGGATSASSGGSAGRGGAGGGQGGDCQRLELPDGGVPGDCSKPNMVHVAFADGTPFCIDRWEVRRGEYRAWLDSCPELGTQRVECLDNVSYSPTMGLYDCDALQDGLDGDPLRPVVCVDWCDADAYCRGVGKRLCGAKGGGATPFDAVADAAASEWYSVCSDHGQRLYGYGNALQLVCVSSEYTGEPGAAAVAEPAPVATCKDPVYNLWDLSGNVWEWEDSCETATGLGDRCRTRGGSFWEAAAALTCAQPGPTNHVRSAFNNNIGFRCCADPNPG